jgi:hypothetical protein
MATTLYSRAGDAAAFDDAEVVGAEAAVDGGLLPGETVRVPGASPHQ